MKKSFILLSFLSAAIAFVSCNKIEGIETGDDGQANLLPQTEVFFQSQRLFYEGEQKPEGTRA